MRFYTMYFDHIYHHSSKIQPTSYAFPFNFVSFLFFFLITPWVQFELLIYSQMWGHPVEPDWSTGGHIYIFKATSFKKDHDSPYPYHWTFVYQIYFFELYSKATHKQALYLITFSYTHCVSAILNCPTACYFPSIVSLCLSPILTLFCLTECVLWLVQLTKV